MVSDIVNGVMLIRCISTALWLKKQQSHPCDTSDAAKTFLDTCYWLDSPEKTNYSIFFLQRTFLDFSSCAQCRAVKPLIPVLSPGWFGYDFNSPWECLTCIVGTLRQGTLHQCTSFKLCLPHLNSQTRKDLGSWWSILAERLLQILKPGMSDAFLLSGISAVIWFPFPILLSCFSA